MTRTSLPPSLVPITLPRASVRTSSVRELSSSRAISLCCSSRPGTPGVSINRFSNASLNGMGNSLFGDQGRLATARRRVKAGA